MNTEWRVCPSFGGRYKVSSEGKVRRTQPSVNQFPSDEDMATRINDLGYEDLLLTFRKGRRKWARVHSLVAETFLGPRPDGCEVNHKNGDRKDNRAANLEYVSAKDNVRHAFRTTRTHKAVDFFGSKMCLAEVVDLFGAPGLAVPTAWQRIKKGESVLEAISRPARKWVRKAA